MDRSKKVTSRGLNRRKFLEILSLVSAAGFLPFKRTWAKTASQNSGPRARVALAGIVKGANDDVVADAVRYAAKAATDFSWLSKGDTVLIKIALNSGNPYPATTDPVGIKTIVELLKKKGAGRVVVSDMAGVEHVKLYPDRITGSTRELMNKSGIATAALASGAELYFPEEDGWDAFFEDRPVSGSNWLAGIMVPKILNEVNHIVLMPRCGRHLLAGSSLGMKTVVGYFRHDSRLEYHRDASTFQEKTAEANTVPSIKDKQRLVLTSATKILTTLGPDKGYISEPDIGFIIASESLVAHDMVSLAWLIENRRLTPEEAKTIQKDPYMNPQAVDYINRIVVRWLGGSEAGKKAEKLTGNNLDTIWNDRVLNRAYELFGGIPKVDLIKANDTVTEDILKKMGEMTSKSI
jgi:uncharacterized protein (DUF362 family)